MRWDPEAKCSKCGKKNGGAYADKWRRVCGTCVAQETIDRCDHALVECKSGKRRCVWKCGYVEDPK